MGQFIKKTAAAVLAFVLAQGMAACNREMPVQVREDPQSQPEYLNFFSPVSMSDTDLVKYWSDQFVEKYNKTVYVNYDSATYYADEGLSYRELLEKRLQGKMPDDLYIINAEDVIEFDQRGCWMDLSEMDFVENLTEAALSQSTYDGKVFSVPLSFTGFGFYWNVDMLEAYGLTVPENLNEFLAVCEKLKAEGILPYGANKGYALTVPAMSRGLARLYASSDKEQLIADLNSEKEAISTYMREGFDFLSQLIDSGYLDPKQAMDTVPGEEWDLFLNGKCAFICISLGVALQEPEENGFRTRMTGVPALPDGTVAVYGANSRLCVNPNSQNLQIALDFIEMVGTAEALDRSALLDHTMSCAKNSEIMTASPEKAMCELLKSPGQIPNQDFALHFNIWENVRNCGREICGGASVEEVCAKLDGLQRTELKAYTGK